ncbi:LysR family transcriptional regulator [Polyangium mundeleinium]|uniref:LysR family transcriptional regulator n=1 Tax=Polyangium mundeleinium TaxID=2995306 RepID=A0ABT5ES22_9BACT|nr:LysR family transcriptional regulator [Polyangium mundeleinium]MDC0743575.1 LysR family transcriptional regulator [Polyangium mundeleinium]
MHRVHDRFDTMDLNLLRVFEAVFRERHLTRAARVLALSPSAVSHALRRLREHLDDPLFEREGTEMVPTATCLRMAPALVEQLAQLRGLLHRWGTFEPSTTTLMFRIGMPDSIEPMLVPQLRSALAKAAPLATLASVAYQRSAIARELASRQIDLAFDVSMPVHEPVQHRRVLEDDFCLVVRDGHPLRGKLTVAQYVAASHVLVSSRATGLVLEDHGLLRLGVERRVVVRCQSYDTAFRVVADSDDVLTAPRRLTGEVGKVHALSRRALPFKLPPVKLHIYWHAHAESDPANMWLRGFVEEVANAGSA